jgi:hypothetical protein
MKDERLEMKVAEVAQRVILDLSSLILHPFTMSFAP